jgi:hypothetical protein
MKKIIFLFVILSTNLFAQDPKVYLSNFYSKIYSLKTKGVKDFVVDISSSRLTNQINDQMTFGKVKNLVFRVYWTANPERLDVEILGLPEGFRELKQGLKLSLLSLMENLLPPSFEQKFNGFEFTRSSNTGEFIAVDKSGVAPIGTYYLKFDSKDSLTEVEGKPAIGSFVVKTEYVKTGFSDGKLVLMNQVSDSSQNGVTVQSKKKLEYGDSKGIGVLEEVQIETTTKSAANEKLNSSSEETLEFKNYRIDSGLALKYFLGENVKK